MRGLSLAGLLVPGLLFPATAAADSAVPERLHWRLEVPARDESGPTAVAVSGDGRLALGDGRGIRVRDAAGGWREYGVREGVADLVFEPGGALWVASGAGLLRWADGRLEPHPVGPASGRAVVRVASGGGVLAVATATGVFLRVGKSLWKRVEGSFGPSPVSGLAAGGGTLWIAAPRGLFRVARLDRSALRAEPAAPSLGLGPALDVWADGGRVLALGPDRLAVRDGAREPWRVERPVLPPGSTPLRVAAGLGRLWIATDRGLVAGGAAAGPWRRAGGPAGNDSTAALAFEGDRLLAASTRGLWVGGPRAGAAGLAPQPCEPSVGALHRAVLRHVSLDLRTLEQLGRGVHRRGWLPLLTLRADTDRGRDRGYEYDEAFVSGDTRSLHDRDRGESRDRGLSLTLSWDFGDLLYNPEEIDVSAERRRLLELRDDVLGEVNQLYFERRRALAALRRMPEGSVEADEAALRAAELAAGLDGWTGGWFGAQLDACLRGRG